MGTARRKDDKPRMVGVREFREHFTELLEPVTVIRSRRPTIETLGTWTPDPDRMTKADEKAGE